MEVSVWTDLGKESCYEAISFRYMSGRAKQTGGKHESIR
jgi:hypothetical protein